MRCCVGLVVVAVVVFIVVVVVVVVVFAVVFAVVVVVVVVVATHTHTLITAIMKWSVAFVLRTVVMQQVCIVYRSNAAGLYYAQ